MLFQSLATFACMKDQTWSNSIILSSFFSCFENYQQLFLKLDKIGQYWCQSLKLDGMMLPYNRSQCSWLFIIGQGSCTPRQLCEQRFGDWQPHVYPLWIEDPLWDVHLSDCYSKLRHIFFSRRKVIHISSSFSVLFSNRIFQKLKCYRLWRFCLF